MKGNQETLIEELSTEAESFSAPIMGGRAFHKQTDNSLRWICSI